MVTQTAFQGRSGSCPITLYLIFMLLFAIGCDRRAANTEEQPSAEKERRDSKALLTKEKKRNKKKSSNKKQEKTKIEAQSAA